MRDSASAVRVAVVFPSVLGTYGDGGNGSVLAQRLRWRGQVAETIDVGIDQPLPAEADLYVLGGGEDSAQTLATSRLASGTLRRRADEGAVVFAVCAGFQILGESYLEGSGAVRDGLGLIDCRTDRLPGTRAVGELLGECRVPGVGTVTGYENHGGRTVLGPAASPFADVQVGVGNGAGSESAEAVDGAVQGTVVATYLHGPALARNPALADHLLSLVVGALPPIDDTAEQELRAERLAAVRRAGRTRRWRLGGGQWRPPANG